jgi:hypothetical protein
VVFRQKWIEPPFSSEFRCSVYLLYLYLKQKWTHTYGLDQCLRLRRFGCYVWLGGSVESVWRAYDQRKVRCEAEQPQAHIRFRAPHSWGQASCNEGSEGNGTQSHIMRLTAYHTAYSINDTC